MFSPVSLIFDLLLKRTSIGEKAAQPLAWVITIALAIILAWSGWAILKGSIIDDYKAGEQGKRAEQQLVRQEDAQAQDDKLEKRDQDKIDALKKGARDAENKDPQAAHSSVGPVTTSVIDGLRKQPPPKRDPARD